MIRFRPLPLMSVMSIVALAVLMMAGRWQWEKYELKLAAAAAPVPEMTIASYQPLEGGLQFVYGNRTDTREQGWRVFTPVQYGDEVVFIDADFVPGVSPPDPREVRVPASLRYSQPFSGASIRPSPPAPLTLAPRPLERLWFAVDLDAMGRNAGAEHVADYYLAGDYVGEDGRAHRNPFARAPGADELPPARHLGYALTWYGLALVLLVIYFAYHVSVKRLVLAPPRPPED
ncbi:cytochrome oxidase biogenesis protein Surf1 [alpha proteobacterium U9-1i]|nr:cytochrome oxidase biogenesis protein Surf1 [alpha proteobacterium U9-1i]